MERREQGEVLRASREGEEVKEPVVVGRTWEGREAGKCERGKVAGGRAGHSAG